VFNEFQENTYVLWDETKECVIVDPDCYAPAEQSELVDFIRLHQLKPVKLLNTHCHIDHVLGNDRVMQQYDIELYMHEGEIFTYNDTLRWTTLFGMPSLLIPIKKVFVSEKDSIKFGNSTLSIAFTPGHSAASITFYNLEWQFAIVGDVLFRESIGRTDLPGGNYNMLIHSIRTQLLLWPDEMRIYSGHGELTTIGHERKFNSFLNQ